MIVFGQVCGQISSIIKLTLVLQVICFASVNTKCTSSYSTKCETVRDVAVYGKKEWTSLSLEKSERNRFEAPVDELNEGAFSNLKNLEELVILGQVKEVKANAFSGLDKLTTLKMHNNNLVVVKQRSFSGFRYLQNLDLQRNNIENIDHGLFEDSTIISINLSNNKLTNIQVGQLNLPSLKRLNLANNNLYFFAPGCFHENLEELNLQNGNIKDIHRDVVTPLTNLRELDLSKNKLEHITKVPELTSLEKLDLSRNNIRHIETTTFAKNFELRHLNLGYNQLTYLSDKIFPKQNSKLTNLYIHKNKLTALNAEFSRLTNLREVSFGGNPWPCPCLFEVERFLVERNIEQEECEKDLYKEKGFPICIDFGKKTCLGTEDLNSSDVVRYDKILEKYDC